MIVLVDILPIKNVLDKKLTRGTGILLHAIYEKIKIFFLSIKQNIIFVVW